MLTGDQLSDCCPARHCPEILSASQLRASRKAISNHASVEGVCGKVSAWLPVPAVQVDMAKEAEVEALIRHTLSAHGRLDVFVNNAARYVFAETLEVTEEGGPRHFVPDTL